MRRMTPAVAYVAAAALLLFLAAPAGALINAMLQPVDLVQAIHKNVLVAQIVSADAGAGTIRLRVESVLKGDAKDGAEIVIAADEAMKKVLAGMDKDALKPGTRCVAFAEKLRPFRPANEFKIYWSMGWLLGSVESADRWSWDKTDIAEAKGIDGQEIMTLGGTWCGSTDKLIELVRDVRAGTAFLPRKAYCRFGPDLPLLLFEGPVLGAALYDIDGDGDLDIYACCQAGDRMLFQVPPEPGEDADEPAPPVGFADATEYVGLAGVSGPSVSFADVNADGRADLLAGATIYLAGPKLRNRFTRSDLLPEDARKDLKCAAFVELNGDGYPDVIVSRVNGGLRAYLNAGAKGGPFTDVTKAMGLDRPECGAKQTGFFAAGEWNGDGKADLFYAAGKGFLLVQDASGVFSPVEHDVAFGFEDSESEEPGLTGASVFAPLLSFDRNDLLIPGEAGWWVVANRGGKCEDVSDFGGEVSEGSFQHVATIAGDFNLDGYVDTYTVARGENGQNRMILYRGYGMFMHAEKNPHYETVFQGREEGAHQRGGWGLAAGDVDGDGAPDLLIGNARGELALLLNETLKLRARPEEHPIDDVRRLSEGRVLNVRVNGRLGVLGAQMALTDARGRCVGRRQIGDNIATGCRGPDAVDFGILTGGKYELTVRFSDGHVQMQPVDLTAPGRARVDLKRAETTTAPAAPATGPAG